MYVCEADGEEEGAQGSPAGLQPAPEAVGTRDGAPGDGGLVVVQQEGPLLAWEAPLQEFQHTFHLAFSQPCLWLEGEVLEQ